MKQCDHLVFVKICVTDEFARVHVAVLIVNARGDVVSPCRVVDVVLFKLYTYELHCLVVDVVLSKLYTYELHCLLAKVLGAKSRV